MKSTNREAIVCFHWKGEHGTYLEANIPYAVTVTDETTADDFLNTLLDDIENEEWSNFRPKRGSHPKIDNIIFIPEVTNGLVNTEEDMRVLIDDAYSRGYSDDIRSVKQKVREYE